MDVNIQSSSSAILLGCSVAVVSSGLQSLGITLQRKSHLLPIHLEDDHSHHYYLKSKRNMWLFGFFLFIISNVLGSIIQITTLPLIILSPLQSIGLIFNSLLSCLLLPGESFTWKLGMGTFVISIGAFIIAYNGNPVPPPPDSNDPETRFNNILMSLADRRFLCWFIGTFVFIGVLLLSNILISRRRNILKDRTNKRHSKSVNQILEKLKFIKGINFGLVSGTLTAHTFLFAKSLIDVIVESILYNAHDIQGITKNITPYMLLLVMLMIVGFQLTAFNLGLAQISSSILYPLCFLVYNLMNLINDLTYNHLLANNRMTVSQLLWVIIGLMAVLLGVVLISWDSAVGVTNTIKLSCVDEDEYILHSKFPYTDNEVAKLAPASASSYELDIDYSTSTHLNPNSIYPLSGNRNKKKRILSYEQKQLLNQLDIV